MNKQSINEIYDDYINEKVFHDIPSDDLDNEEKVVFNYFKHAQEVANIVSTKYKTREILKNLDFNFTVLEFSEKVLITFWDWTNKLVFKTIPFYGNEEKLLIKAKSTVGVSDEEFYKDNIYADKTISFKMDTTEVNQARYYLDVMEHVVTNVTDRHTTFIYNNFKHPQLQEGWEDIDSDSLDAEENYKHESNIDVEALFDYLEGWYNGSRLNFDKKRSERVTDEHGNINIFISNNKGDTFTMLIYCNGNRDVFRQSVTIFGRRNFGGMSYEIPDMTNFETIGAFIAVNLRRLLAEEDFINNLNEGWEDIDSDDLDAEENTHNNTTPLEDYVNDMAEFANQQNARVHNWKLELDEMSGSWGWFNDDYSNVIIWGTPFWTNDYSIPIDISNMDGDYDNYKEIDFKPTYNIRVDFSRYVRLIAIEIRGMETFIKQNNMNEGWEDIDSDGLDDEEGVPLKQIEVGDMIEAIDRISLGVWDGGIDAYSEISRDIVIPPNGMLSVVEIRGIYMLIMDENDNVFMITNDTDIINRYFKII